MKDGMTLMNEVEEVISFNPLTLFNAGVYCCEIVVESVTYKTNNFSLQSKFLLLPIIIIMTFDYNNNYAHIFIVPIITFVEVTSNKPNPIRPIGSDVMLTCTVEVNEAVDVPVAVDISWTIYNENIMQTNRKNGNTYISTAWINEFGIEMSRFYICLVTVTVMAENSTSTHIIHEYEGSKLITTGTYFSTLVYN